MEILCWGKKIQINSLNNTKSNFHRDCKALGIDVQEEVEDDREDRIAHMALGGENRAALLPAMSDKEGKEKSDGLTDEGTTFTANGVVDGTFENSYRS